MEKRSLKRLFSIARPEMPFLLWGLLFLIISSAASLVYPQVVRWMVDHVLEPKKSEMLTPVVGVLFLAFVLQGIAGSLRYYLFTLSGERIVIRLRAQLFEKILKQEISFFDFNRTGELMSRLASDCTTLQNTVSVNVSMGLRNLGQVLGGLGFMFYTSWQLTSVMFILIPPMAGAAALFGKKIRKSSKQAQESLADASIIAEESISGVRTVVSFVQENAETVRYRAALENTLLQVKSRIKAIAQFMTLAMIVGFGAVAGVLWYGGLKVIQGELSIGDITQFLLYLLLVAIGVGSLGSLWGDFMAGLGASNRVFEILERSPEMVDKGLRLDHIKGQVEFKNVSFKYPTRPESWVLQELSFKMTPGQITALVGSSGSGKTTIGSLLPRFYEVSLGEVQLDGQNITQFQPSWLREQIGIVSQEPVLISTSIEENIRYARPEANFEEVKKAAEAANAMEFILKFPEGFKTKVGEKGMQLSGGQKQRIAIARALLKDPQILILDEATSNLDTASEHLVQEALVRLMKGRTTLVIAHRLATIKNADQILVIRDGKIIQQGKHEELAENQSGLYYELLQRQFIETHHQEKL